MYKLYKITNKITEKSYIGITKLSLTARWNKHLLKDSLSPKYPLHRAIAKYGPDNFTIELLLENESRTLISSLEEPTIQQYNTRSNGYNVAKGGYGGDLGPEANTKRRLTILSRSDAEKQRLAEMQRARQLGKTKETNLGRKSQSEKIKGNKFREAKPHDAESKQKISMALTGKAKSDTTKSKMSAAAKANQNGNRFAGRRVSCLCCLREWDIGNFTQHIKRNNNEL